MDQDMHTSVAALPDFMPARPCLASDGKGWSGITARVYHINATPNEVLLPAVPAFGITLRLSSEEAFVERSFGGAFTRVNMRPHALVFHPANQSVRWRWDSPADIFKLYIDHRFLLNHIVGDSDLPPQLLEELDMCGIEDPLLAQIGCQLVRELANDRPLDRVYIESIGALIVAHLFHSYTSARIGSEAKASGHTFRRLDSIIEYINNNLDRDLSVEELAGIAHLSLYHFIRHFKAVIGKTPHQYILECRISLARRLLANTTTSIFHIGQRLGFSNQSHFTNTFRHHVGITPRHYRRRHADAHFRFS